MENKNKQEDVTLNVFTRDTDVILSTCCELCNNYNQHTQKVGNMS